MTPAPHVVAVMGRGVVDADEPVIMADDLGLTRGDGCFDSVLVLTGGDGVARVVDLEEHLARLAASATALEIPNPPDSSWRALVDQAISAWCTPGEAVLKLLLTRGREWQAGLPTAVVTVTHRAPPGTVEVATAARAITAVTLTRGHPSDAFLDAPWLLGGVKTLSYVVNVAAQREARARGADDVIFTSTDGFALDGPTSGLLVARGGVLLSTPTGGTGILASVTIDAIFQGARRNGLDARYALIPITDLYTADGVWLVSSGRGPAPVTVLDGQRLSTESGLVARVAGYAGFVPARTTPPGDPPERG